MSPRLTVLMVRPASADDCDRLDDLVGQTLGRPSLDLLIIADRPSRLDVAAPDRLSLEHVASPLASVAWMSADEMVDELRELGHAAVRGRHAGDPAAPASSPGALTVLHFDMRGVSAAENLVPALESLARRAATPTVSIGGRPGRGVNVGPVSPPVAANRPSDGSLDELLARFDQLDL